MKILHWDEMFHPNFGYQINLLAKFQAKQGHEVVIYTAETPERHPIFKGLCSGDTEQLDREYEQTNKVRIVRLPYFKVVSGRVIYQPGYLKKIKSEEPDILMVHTNDTLSAMNIAKHARYLNMPMIFDNHMLEMASQNSWRNVFRFYFRKRITPIIKRNRWIVIRTQDDDYVNRCLGIPEKLTPFISFGTDTMLFEPNQQIRDEMRKKYDISEDAFVVVYTGKLDRAKNGKLLARAFREKISEKKEVVLIAVGTAVGEYGKEVEHIFKESKNRILRFPTQPYTELHKFYQAADLSVFPQQCSLSFYDAQSCALPVVSENNKVNVDRVSRGNGYCFQSGSVDSFRETVRRCVEMDTEAYEAIRENARKNALQYDYEDVARQYTRVMKYAIRRFEKEKSNGGNKRKLR
ncbi:MAG: glycosyltransferase family 4 protein [Lachnospiraceae bacterium]|nr:glycosyltransferase family 4 protein [Lachnospiraceae bacterium]